jgi:hypothetical protein
MLLYIKDAHVLKIQGIPEITSQIACNIWLLLKIVVTMFETEIMIRSASNKMPIITLNN